jgi:hypothetical protein
MRHEADQRDWKAEEKNERFCNVQRLIQNHHQLLFKSPTNPLS